MLSIHDLAVLAPFRRQATRGYFVDDLEEAREPMREMLLSLGLDADAADSGEAAVNAVLGAAQSGHPYRLVLIDWRMPEMDGFATACRLGELAVGPRPTLVLVSAVAPDLTREALSAAGFAGFLAKPATPSALYDALLEVLRPDTGVPTGHA